MAEKVLEVAGLWSGYGEGMVLQGVDLAAERGRVTCLVGRNGAGKTTTLKTDGLAACGAG